MSNEHAETLPINFLKYCPHCGSNRFAPRTSKEFVCGNCNFRFFTNSAAAVAAVIIDDSKRIMLTRRAVEPWRGMLDLPGGFVDPGEAAETALRRELHEELSAEIIDMHYICSFPNSYIFSGYMVATTDMAFECTIRTADNALVAHDDIDAIEWFKPEELPFERIAAPSIRNILKHYIAIKHRK